MADIPYPSSAQAEQNLEELPTPLNVFRMLNHAPLLTEPTVLLGKAILASTALSPRLREMAILIVASRTGCSYERNQHTPIALAVGVTSKQIDALAAGEITESHFTAQHRCALAAVTELLASHNLEPATLASLQERFSDQEVVELIALTGYYTMLAGLANGLDVDVDPAGELLAPLVKQHEQGSGTATSPTNDRETS
ncbi:carboxymuconolactone decarboxylase family protein [Streptomyces sp. NBC_01174]|uniref:carboxymuconolactone decarboxylase family protein n=1 Tax=Streptomyces sp. NBC_01174 TaxID=2903758 RepID=UPI00386E7B38|nr:carboxymuconolactone decarboxylase family protein [Streptomyces sp. NBC_01177]WSS74468.1 carboxymuconolactone decarboxylase family protein [Streptomyces sp. NBC_01174]